MHEAAHAWVEKWAATDEAASVLDIGGRDINGNVRDLFPNAARYLVIDMYPGENVDIVTNAATWEPDDVYDIVVCAEVFEHTAYWPEICLTAKKALCSGGLFVATMAGPGRPPHSAIDGEFRLHPGEYYANVAPADLDQVLRSQGWKQVIVDQAGLDVRVAASA